MLKLTMVDDDGNAVAGAYNSGQITSKEDRNLAYGSC